MLPMTNKLVPGPAIVHVVKISGASKLLAEHCPVCSAIGRFPDFSHWIENTAHLLRLVVLLCRSAGCDLPSYTSNRLAVSVQ